MDNILAPIPQWNYLRVRGEYGSAKMQSLGATELPPRTRRIHHPRVGPPVRGELPPRTRRIHHTLVIIIDMKGTTSAYAENTPNELGIL